MPKKKRIPFSLYAHPPVQLAGILIEHGCGSQRNLSVMDALFKLVDFDAVGSCGTFIGATCIISNIKLAERCFMSERNVRYAIDELEGKKVIRRYKVGKCHRYNILIYQTALKYLADNPDIPHDEVTSPSPPPDRLKSIHEDVAKTDTNMATDATMLANNEPIMATIAINQELLQEDLEEPTVSDGLGTNEASEKRGGDINLEDKDSPKGKDIVPTTEIGKAKEVDELVEAIMGTKLSKSNTKPPEDGIEPFIDSFNDAFNLESVAVLSQGYVEPALELQKGISSKLSAAGLALPVNRFLGKYLVPCVYESLADGTLDELPRAFGFFLRKPKGKQVLDRSVGVAKASNSVTQSVERTKTFLGGLKGREPVPESSKERVSDMIANIKPISADETKRLRRLRE